MRNKKTSRSRTARTTRAPSAPIARTKPRDDDDSRGVLVAVELGAGWPELPPMDESSSRRVLSQRDGEAPAAFAERVGSSLENLFGRGVTLANVTLSCNERTDVAAEDARRKLAGLALGSMAKNQTGRVYLTAPTRSSGRVRSALTSLAQGLHDEWSTAGLEVSVDFGERAAAVPAPIFAFTARVA
jgi:hypothetical protein